MHIIITLYLILVVLHIWGMRYIYINNNRTKKDIPYMVLISFLFPTIWIAYFHDKRKSK